MIRNTIVILALVATVGVCQAAETHDIAPVAVWSPTHTHPSGQSSLENLIDDDLATVCCFLDDTPTGKGITDV